MGAYSYKDVMYRGDFQAAIKPAMEAIGRTHDDYDGDANYNGDGWVVAAFLPEQKDADLAAERARAETLKQQAEIWKQEARTQQATVHAIYQLCTGGKGEPGDWHGAEPVRAVIADRDRLRAAIEQAPHGHDCQSWKLGRDTGKPCDCWKRAALADARVMQGAG